MPIEDDFRQTTSCVVERPGHVVWLVFTDQATADFCITHILTNRQAVAQWRQIRNSGKHEMFPEAMRLNVGQWQHQPLYHNFRKAKDRTAERKVLLLDVEKQRCQTPTMRGGQSH